MNKKLKIILFAFFLLSFTSLIFIKMSGYDISSLVGWQMVSTYLVVTESIGAYCNITLIPGWNLVSFPCINSDLQFNDAFKNMSGPYETIRFYYPNDGLDPWKSYNPDLPNWVVQDLSTISRKYGYWIYVANTTNFYLENLLGTPTIIDLPVGWSLLGYPKTYNSDINDTFGQLIPNFEYVYTYNASDSGDPWKEWTWNTSKYTSTQDLNETKRYSGYWIYINNTDQWVMT